MDNEDSIAEVRDAASKYVGLYWRNEGVHYARRRAGRTTGPVVSGGTFCISPFPYSVQLEQVKRRFVDARYAMRRIAIAQERNRIQSEDEDKFNAEKSAETMHQVLNQLMRRQDSQEEALGLILTRLGVEKKITEDQGKPFNMFAGMSPGVHPLWGGTLQMRPATIREEGEEESLEEARIAEREAQLASLIPLDLNAPGISQNPGLGGSSARFCGAGF